MTTIEITAAAQRAGLNLATAMVVYAATCPEHGRLASAHDGASVAAHGWSHLESAHGCVGRIEAPTPIDAGELTRTFLASQSTVAT